MRFHHQSPQINIECYDTCKLICLKDHGDVCQNKTHWQQALSIGRLSDLVSMSATLRVANLSRKKKMPSFLFLDQTKIRLVFCLVPAVKKKL